MLGTLLPVSLSLLILIISQLEEIGGRKQTSFEASILNFLPLDEVYHYHY